MPREQTLTITSEMLVRGLRPDERIGPNSGLMSALNTVKPTEFGLRAPTVITEKPSEAQLSAAGISKAGSYPQAFKGSRINLVVTDTLLFSGDDNWDLTSIPLYLNTDPDGSTTTISIDTQRPWTFIDMGDSWILYRDDQMIHRSKLHSRRAILNAGVVPQIAQHFQGRIFFGNDISTIHPVWGAGSVDRITWSSIGLDDWIWPLIPGDVPSDDIRDEIYVDRNDAGFAIMPGEGQIRAMHVLGRAESAVLVVYADNAICVLRATTNPEPGYDIKWLSDIGIGNPKGILAHRDQHIFMDGNEQLWRLLPDLQLIKLDYSEYMADINTIEMSASIDESEGDIYFSNASAQETLVLTKTGAYRSRYHPHSLYREDGQVFGIITDTGVGFVESIVIDFLDMGIRELKLITGIQVQSEDITALTVQVFPRFDQDGALVTGPPAQPANPLGQVTPICQGLEFRIQITGAFGANAKINSVIIKWKLASATGTRGEF